MNDLPDPHAPSDVSLLLRAHAEQLWLSREILPVLHDLQTPAELPEEQLGAALAYLEVAWLEAARLAGETDASYAELEMLEADTHDALPSQARRYHASVRALRDQVARSVRVLLATPGMIACAGQRVLF